MKHRINLSFDQNHTYRFRTFASNNILVQVWGTAECPHCGTTRAMWHDINGQRVQTHRLITCARCNKPWWGRFADRLRDFRDERANDRAIYLDRDCCRYCEDDWRELPVWRKTWARIGGQR